MPGFLQPGRQGCPVRQPPGDEAHRPGVPPRQRHGLPDREVRPRKRPPHPREGAGHRLRHRLLRAADRADRGRQASDDRLDAELGDLAKQAGGGAVFRRDDGAARAARRGRAAHPEPRAGAGTVSWNARQLQRRRGFGRAEPLRHRRPSARHDADDPTVEGRGDVPLFLDQGRQQRRGLHEHPLQAGHGYRSGGPHAQRLSARHPERARLPGASRRRQPQAEDRDGQEQHGAVPQRRRAGGVIHPLHAAGGLVHQLQGGGHGRDRR